MVTAYFLRHGPTKENKEELVQGQQPGTLLVPETERYLTAVTPLLREGKINMIISSDLRRAWQTSHILREFLEIEEAKELHSPLLRERAMGFYEGRAWTEVPLAFWGQKLSGSNDFRAFGGENDDDVRSRVKYFLKALSVKYVNMRVVCVTHAGWLRQLLSLAGAAAIEISQWTGRTEIYRVRVRGQGVIEAFDALDIEADVELDDECGVRDGVKVCS